MMWSFESLAMNIHLRNPPDKINNMVAMTTFALFLFSTRAMAFANPQDTWNCEETAFYSIYEDISRTESRETSNAKTLKWIDADTIGFEAISLERAKPDSETYFNQNSGSSLQIIQTERPYLVVLTQPQVWMNKFGNLRVRFYRCTP